MVLPARSLSVFVLPMAMGLAIISLAGKAGAVEEAKYTVVRKDGAFQIRKYESRVVAETQVDGSFSDAGNKAFNRLFDYISGKNASTQKIAMTAPVTQQVYTGTSSGEKIAMTAPVIQQQTEGKYRVAFILPASYTLETAPKPLNADVTIKSEPESLAAVVEYSGSWSKASYDENLKKLQDWMTSNSLTAKGKPTWARYNSPYSLPLFRRNEVIIPIEDPDGKPKAGNSQTTVP